MFKQFNFIILGTVLIGFGLISCGSESTTSQEKTTVTTTTTTANTSSKVTTSPAGKTDPAAKDKAAKAALKAAAEPVLKIDWNASELLIQDAGLGGIFIGQPIGTVENRIKKQMAKNSEGEFIAYYFIGKNKKKLGYFIPDPENRSLIGDVIVTSPEAATKDGIKIGSTFAELKTVAPDLVVHGSEIESRTHAYVGRVAYLLDAAFNTYEVDEKAIKPDTKIKGIRLMCHLQKK